MAEKLRVGVVLASFVAFTAWADAPCPSALITPTQPQWSELTVEQKTILAPLSDDWDAMEYYRQKKWLGITRRFSNMTPEEQRRIQVQMQEWGKLTPEERRLARENFKTANQLPVEKKQQLRQKWEEYSSLPEEEKERLKQQADTRAVDKRGRADTNAAPPGPATSSASPPLAPPPSMPETRSPLTTSSSAPPAGEVETRR